MKKNVLLVIIVLTIETLILFAMFIIRREFEVFYAVMLALNPILFAALYVSSDKEKTRHFHTIEEQEENFSNFFTSIKGMAFVLDINGNILFSNDSASRILGYSKDEFNKIHFCSLFTIKDQEEAKSYCRGIHSGGDASFSLMFLDKNKKSFTAEIRSWRGKWRGEECIFCVSYDISAEKIALDKFSKIFKNNTSLMVVIGVDDRIVKDVNKAFLTATGYERDDLVGMSARALTIFENLEIQNNIRDIIMRDGRLVNTELKIRRKDGMLIHGICSAEIIDTYAEKLILAMMVDYTAQKKAENALKEDIVARKALEKTLDNERRLLKTTLLSIGDAVISTDSYGRILLMNKVGETLTGWKEKEASGKILYEVMRVVDGNTHGSIIRPDPEAVPLGSTMSFGDMILTSRDGAIRYIEGGAAPVEGTEGNKPGLVLVFRDVTEKRRKQEIVEYLSRHDQLTGLYNRSYYDDKLAQLEKADLTPISIIMSDVNNLKLANDAFGHSMGDKLLTIFAGTLERVCRGKNFTPIRIGGDEFVIIMPGANEAEAAKFVKKLEAETAAARADKLIVSAAFGWAERLPEEELHMTFKRAEDEMYRNKMIKGAENRAEALEFIMESLFSIAKGEKEHSLRVGMLAKKIGRAMGLSETEQQSLETAGRMHDIGKVGVDPLILNKPGVLNEYETAEIKRHSEIGYRIFGALSDYSSIAESVLMHHERWDGKGYPEGVAGGKIPLAARIISVADAYDAMTHDRVYRKAMSKKLAEAELSQNAGLQFDPEIINIFLNSVVNNPNI